MPGPSSRSCSSPWPRCCTGPSAGPWGRAGWRTSFTSSCVTRPAQGGTAESPITWVFEPESFAPLAKLVGDSRYSLVTDHLGTPKAMFDATGAEVWSASIDAYGDLRNIKGHRQSCPFRYPGQYEDQARTRSG
jgi:hypothetical protein